MAIYTFNEAVKKEGAKPTEVKSLGVMNIQTPEMVEEEKNSIVEFAKGVGKGFVSNTQALGKLGLEAISLGKIDTDKLGVSEETLKASNNAQKAGKVVEGIAEFLIPIGGAPKVGNAIKGATKAVTSAPGKVVEAGSKVMTAGKNKLPSVAKAFLGEADTEVVKAAQNPMTKLFRAGKKTGDTVVKNIEKSIEKFETQSKAALKAVKDTLPNSPLAPQEIAERVNQGIMNSVQNSADYRGIQQGFETAEDIISSGVLKPEEGKRIQDVVTFIGKWKDNSVRGTLNLKEALSNFYATGENYTGSNAMIRSIQRNLVELVSEKAPTVEIRQALKTASQNIDQTEDFIRHLFGKDAVSGEAKIMNLARNMSDKAKNAYKLKLVEALEKASGSKLFPELQGLADYLKSQSLKAPGLQKPLETLKFGVKKAVEKKVPLK